MDDHTKQKKIFGLSSQKVSYAVGLICLTFSVVESFRLGLHDDDKASGFEGVTKLAWSSNNFLKLSSFILILIMFLDALLVFGVTQRILKCILPWMMMTMIRIGFNMLYIIDYIEDGILGDHVFKSSWPSLAVITFTGLIMCLFEYVIYRYYSELLMEKQTRKNYEHQNNIRKPSTAKVPIMGIIV